jgi:hypothetical protein
MAIIFVLAIPLIGCPVSGTSPLGNREDALMDDKLLGTWEAITIDKTEEGNILIFQFNDKELYLEGKGKSDNSVSRSRIFITVIDNVKFMNWQEIKNYNITKEYLYLKYNITDDNMLQLWYLNSNYIPKDKTDGPELVSFIKRNINMDKLYEKAGIFRRIKGK